jgi:AbrB family looped-hinge helix DNA binding protein
MHASGWKTRKVSERGQITIPKRLREKLSIDSGDEVEIRERDGKISSSDRRHEHTSPKVTVNAVHNPKR